MVTNVIDTLDIKEQFSEHDGLSLQDLARQVAHKDAIFVEVGSWKGYSSSFLGQVAKDCGGALYCVDHWRGTNGVKWHENTENCLEIFRHNMEVLGLSGYVHPLVMESLQAVKIFADGIADLVFLDADHLYNQVKADIQAWYKKVKIGGVLCGHDAEAFYSSLPNQEGIERMFEHNDYVGLQQPDGTFLARFHPGVVKALYECFDDNHGIAKGTSIWMIERKIIEE